jgi:hypothetical protein
MKFRNFIYFLNPSISCSLIGVKRTSLAQIKIATEQGGGSMSPDKRKILNPLLDSEDQIHLTMYFENRKGVSDLIEQIALCIQGIESSLSRALGREEKYKFLAHIVSLMNDSSSLFTLRGNSEYFEPEVDPEFSVYQSKSREVLMLRRAFM